MQKDWITLSPNFLLFTSELNSESQCMLFGLSRWEMEVKKFEFAGMQHKIFVISPAVFPYQMFICFNYIEPFLRGYHLHVQRATTLFWGAFSLIEGQKRLLHCGSNPFLSPPKSCVPASECKLRSTLEQFLLLSLRTMFEEEGWVSHALQEQE